MTDGQLEVKLVPDEQALEEVEKKQLEVSGEADSVQEAQQVNQEQNEKLGGISRTLFRIAKGFSVVVGLLSIFLPVLSKIGEVLDISFSDVRDAFVQIIRELVTTLQNAVPTGGKDLLGKVTGAGGDIPLGFPGLFSPDQLLGGALDLASGFLSGNNQGSSSSQQLNVNLLTSRDQMIGDSTQQEQQTATFDQTLDYTASGGNPQQ